jgi:hypothetical protein
MVGPFLTGDDSFAIPHKHYTRKSIESFSAAYVKDDPKTYKSAVMTDDGMPWYQDRRQALSASTIYRWITALAQLIISSGQDAFARIAHRADSHFYNRPDFAIAKRKYRTAERKRCLLRCLHFLECEPAL